jgi:prepilin-type N-terminal cleavage/methylation domain-containing protein
MNSTPVHKRRALTGLARGEAGFTLVEVMISLVILCFISLGIYQMTVETFRLRDVLMVEGEFYNTIRMSMDIVQRDISSIYSPILSRPTPQGSPSPSPNGGGAPDQETADYLAGDAGRTTQFWQGATEKSGLRPSHFVGTDTKMSFVSLSHVRIYRDSPESDFAKISYEITTDPENKELPDTQMLVKTESPDAFDDDDRRDKRFAHRYQLLHGIKKFKYRYWRKDKDRWETSWDSDKEDMKDKFPDIIEVTFEVVGAQRLSFDGIYKLRPEVPLRGLDPSF